MNRLTTYQDHVDFFIGALKNVFLIRDEALQKYATIEDQGEGVWHFQYEDFWIRKEGDVFFYGHDCCTPSTHDEPGSVDPINDGEDSDFISAVESMFEKLASGRCISFADYYFEPDLESYELSDDWGPDTTESPGMTETEYRESDRLYDANREKRFFKS